jgi:predicted nucleic acid-binding protein
VRLVLDTNAAVSGLLWHGNPGKLIDAAQAGSLILCASAPLGIRIVAPAEAVERLGL